jgi:replicative DNA helicase
MFSLEMSATQLMLRLISAEAEIDSNKLRKGKLENHEWVQLHQKIKNLSNAPIYIDDTPALSILEMRAKCRRLKAQFDIGLVIIDYLQLMTADSGGGAKGNREQEIAAISRAMKNLAKEINVPVIALSQLSRAVETRGGDKRPQLSDLRESGSIEQDADMVMFLYRPEYYKITQDEQGNSTEGVGEVIIAKNRSGDVDTVKLRFIGKYTKFTDLDGFYTPLPGQDNFGDFNMSKPMASASSLENFESSAPSSMPSPTAGGTVTLGSKANQPRNLDDEKDFPF